jgi:hypothetical protein
MVFLGMSTRKVPLNWVTADCGGLVLGVVAWPVSRAAGTGLFEVYAKCIDG